ncbi:MAG: single-stranded DNA-binding protein [Bacteroidales bacterium]|jgi:single-strand DNA-binding protein|nr:single-stranded DNA-binding protein [Bacteroidales bacterium]
MSRTVNRVELTGFAGRDAELVEFGKDNALLRFSIATSESYKRATGEWATNTTWHNVIMWGDAARRGKEIVKKGAKISLVGKLVSRTYEDKVGNKKYIYEVQTSEVKLVEDKVLEEVEA